MKKLLAFTLWIIVFGWVFAMQRANFSLLDISAKRILFTDTGYPTGEKVMDINSWWNIIVYWPLVDSWNNEFVTSDKVVETDPIFLANSWDFYLASNPDNFINWSWLSFTNNKISIEYWEPWLILWDQTLWNFRSIYKSLDNNLYIKNWNAILLKINDQWIYWSGDKKMSTEQYVRDYLFNNYVPRENVSTSSSWGNSDTLLMSQKATTEYVDNNTLFKQSDWFIEAKTLGWWFKICNNMGTTYTWSQNTCLWNINLYLSWNRNLVNWSMNSTDWNYNTILGDTIKTIWDFNLINWNKIENIWNNNAIFWNRNKSIWNNNLIQGFYNRNRNWNRNLIIWENNQTVWWPVQNSIIAWLDNYISWNTANSVVLGSLWVLQNNNSFLFNSSWTPVYSEKNNSFVVYTDWMAINKRSADTWIKLDVNGSIQTNEALYIGSSRRFIIDSDNLSVQNLSWETRVEKHLFTP